MSCDCRELEHLMENLQELDNNLSSFIESCAKELAARFLAHVIPKTPVRRSEDCPPGIVGGTLRRGWTGGKESNATVYAQSLNINKAGNTYVIEIVNPVKYASYVEFGHRKKGGTGWVEGRFMLTISENEINSSAERILENKIKKELERYFK